MLDPGYILKDTYVVEALQARGGMALVYRVHHKELGVTRALKVLQPQFAQDESFVQRFRREAQIMAQLRHPNIAEVYDFGTTPEGWLYLIMEWLEGEDLLTVLKRTPRQSFDAIALLSKQVAGALMVAHEAGVVHRDLKPGNILLCRGPAGEQLKVVDFGIARVRSNETPETLPGVVMGTPGYMAPEQLLGKVDEVDARSDQFALGVILYEMLLGERLFNFAGGSADTLFALALQINQLELPPLPIENQATRSQVERVLRRAMASVPGLRYPTIAEFDAAFREALLDSSRTPSVSVELMAAKHGALQTRRQRPWLSVAALALGMIAITATTSHLSTRNRHSAAPPSAPLKTPSNKAEPPPQPVIVQPPIKPTAPPDPIPSPPIEEPPSCKRTPKMIVNVSDNPMPTSTFIEDAKGVVKQCLQTTKISLAVNKELVLERTNYLHVMSGLSIFDKELLEHCLRTKFTRRPPRRILVKRTVILEGACHAP